MTASIQAFLSGLGIALSFIFAIGAQNAFVLKQGLKNQHVFKICLTCAFSDTILIIAGVLGHREFSSLFPQIKTVIQYLGAAFLILYGVKSFYNAFTLTHSIEDYFPKNSTTDSIQEKKSTQSSAVTAILTTLAFTWLNPHVYLDTVIIIGSFSLKFPEEVRSFTMGAVTASFVFFFALGYGSRILTPFFKNPRSWKILDFVIGGVMLTLGWSLLQEAL